MKISYAITVCDELIEFQTLVEFIQHHRRPQDELVVLHDVDPKNTLEGSPKASICHYCAGAARLKYYYGEFSGDFGKWKNSKEVVVSKFKPENNFYIKLSAKIRYIDPLVN